MKAYRANSKSSLFLIELLIVIAFFAIASTVCVQIFAKSHVISTGSRDLNRAVAVAQSAAEGFKATGGDAAELAEILGGSAAEDGSVRVLYDQLWNRVTQFESRDEAARGFLLQISSWRQEGLSSAHIQVTRGDEPGGEEVFSLETKIYEE